MKLELKIKDVIKSEYNKNTFDTNDNFISRFAKSVTSFVEKEFVTIDNVMEFYSDLRCIKFAEWLAKSGYYARLDGTWEINILGEKSEPITSEDLQELFYKETKI